MARPPEGGRDVSRVGRRAEGGLGPSLVSSSQHCAERWKRPQRPRPLGCQLWPLSPPYPLQCTPRSRSTRMTSPSPSSHSLSTICARRRARRVWTFTSERLQRHCSASNLISDPITLPPPSKVGHPPRDERWHCAAHARDRAKRNAPAPVHAHGPLPEGTVNGGASRAGSLLYRPTAKREFTPLCAARATRRGSQSSRRRRRSSKPAGSSRRARRRRAWCTRARRGSDAGLSSRSPPPRGRRKAQSSKQRPSRTITRTRT